MTTSNNNNQNPIDRDRAMEMLVSVFPELTQHWNSYLEEEYKEPDEERLYYIDIGETVRYIVKKKKNDNTDGFDEFFNRVEEILIYGDNYTQELIVIGLLEGIQNVCGGEVNYYTGFNEWLKPESKKAWQNLIQFWERKRSQNAE